MRAETGREMGEGTSYTGALQPATQRRIAELTAADSDLVPLNPVTDWQRVNIGLLGETPGDTYAEKRANWDARWAADREGMQELQRQRMAGTQPPPVVPPPVVPVVPPRAGFGGYGGYGGFGGFGGGLLGGYGGYPVLGMGTPSGLSYPAAAEAAEGYAGALGFNIGPEGGLVYRPWEARAWQQTGIDPNLWNAPFAGGGLLGGGYPGVRGPVDWTTLPPILPEPGTGGPMPDGTTTATTDTTPTNPFAVDPTKWTPPPVSPGVPFKLDRGLTASGADPFMQWTIAQHAKNQAANAAKWTDPNAVDQFAFEDYKAGQSAIPVTAQGAFGPSAEALAAAARTPYSYTPPTMAGPIPVPSVYTAPSWAQTGLLPPTTSGFVSDF